MSNTTEQTPNGVAAPAGRTMKAVELDIEKLLVRAREIRSAYADEASETSRLDVTARCLLIHVTSAIAHQLGEDTHDEVVRALGFDHLAREMNTSRSKRAPCAELLA